jgi:transposase
MEKVIVGEFVRLHETEDVVDHVAREFASMVIHNTTHGKKDQKQWVDSESYRFFYDHTNSDIRFDVEESTRSFVEHHEDVDDVARDFAEQIFSNVLVKRKKTTWKLSKSYKFFSNYMMREEGRFDLKVQFKKSFATAQPRGRPINPFFVRNPWLSRISSETLECSVFEAASSMRSAYSNYAAGNIDKYRFRFKTKKKQDENGYTIGIGKYVSVEGGKFKFLPKFFGDTGIRYFEKPPFVGTMPCECKVSKDAFGDYWMLIPFYAKKKSRRSEDVLSIDPGVSEPFACYTPHRNDNCFVLGERMNERIKTINDKVSSIDSMISSSEGKRRKELLERRLRLFRKYKNVRDDCHWKIIDDITGDFGIVLLPHLQTGRLSGGLRAKTNRKMFGISHYTFLQRMKFKCSERNIEFFQANERQTTVSCGRCGRKRNMELWERVYKCSCGISCHRDFHAARNIYIKWVVENSRVS